MGPAIWLGIWLNFVRKGYNSTRFSLNIQAGNTMRQAQEVRAGNVIMVGKNPMVVQRAEYNKGATLIEARSFFWVNCQQSVNAAKRLLAIALSKWPSAG